MMSNFSSYFE